MNLRYYATEVLWIAPVVVQLIITVMMRSRKLEREFPFFFVYTFAHLFQFAVIYFIGHLPGRHYGLYFYCYWTLEAILALLVFGVMNEIYDHIFRPYDALRGLAHAMFRWTFAVMLLVSVVVAASSSGTDKARIVRGVLAFDQSLSVVIGGVLFFLFLFSSYLGLKWGDFVFGIALGMALYATVEITAVAIRIHWGMAAANSFAMVRSAAYNCSVLIWAIYCFRRQEARASVGTSLPPNDLARWNEALLALVQR